MRGSFGTPPWTFRSPPSIFRTPLRPFGAPPSMFGSPGHPFRGSPARFGTPASVLGSPGTPFRTSRADFGRSASNFGGSPSDFAGSPGRFRSPTMPVPTLAMGCSGWASKERVPTWVVVIATAAWPGRLNGWVSSWANCREGDDNGRKVFPKELSWANGSFDGNVF